MKDFGEKIRELRKDSNLSQFELSKLIDIPQSTIARYELDKTEPTVTNIKKYCVFFDVSSDYLLGLSDD